MWPGTVLAEGGAALTMALYIVSREQYIAPADVSRAQVGDLIDRQGETDTEIPPRWESRLRALGHDPEAPGDPVSARWRDLRKDNSPPDSAPDAVHFDHGSEYRWGPASSRGCAPSSPRSTRRACSSEAPSSARVPHGPVKMSWVPMRRQTMCCSPATTARPYVHVARPSGAQVSS